MRSLVRFLDEEIPYLAEPSSPVHDDPYRPITRVCKRLVAELPEEKIPIAWWPRKQRYAERLSPGTKFADIIGEIDPAKLATGTSMSAEEALHFGLIPRMHRGIFAMNEIPELDELVQVGLFNILEERDVHIRGYPVQFDIDVLILFSANPATYNRSGKVIPQLKDKGVVTRGWIGVEVRSITPDIAESLGANDLRGAIVAGVQDGGPAAKAGLRKRDAITSVNGEPIKSANELTRKVQAAAPGSSTKLAMVRDNKPGSLSVTLGQLTAQSPPVGMPKP